MIAEATPAEVLRRAAQGDSAALATLFASHAGDIHRTAYRVMLSADDADDVVQDVFIGLPEALRHYEERGSFVSWLKMIAVRTALMRLRAARRRAGSDMLPEFTETPNGPDAHAVHADRM